jgi:hypothetical protein
MHTTRIKEFLLFHHISTCNNFFSNLLIDRDTYNAYYENHERLKKKQIEIITVDIL